MTDSLGRKIDFKNTDIIMTSNIGARQLQEFGSGVGFGTSSRVTSEEMDRKGIIEAALRKAFAPEFLNRVDDLMKTFSKSSISNWLNSSTALLILDTILS